MGATVLLKWSKTLQNRRDARTIAIAKLGASPLCPCALIKQMLVVIPGTSNAHLFSIFTQEKSGPSPILLLENI